jgi:predicted lipase
MVKNRVSMYNFGSPRVGNKQFAEQFAELVPDSWRVHNENDVVAAVPRLMGYCHVPNGVRILDGCKIVMLDKEGVDVLGEGQSVSEVRSDATFTTTTSRALRCSS